MLWILSLIVVSASLCIAQIPEHRITSLPYYNGKLGSQYSGYITLNATTGKSLHYWFVESYGNPQTDPLVLWLNGGPGCSSLDGFFYEQGPLHFVEGSKSLNLTFNPWTWTSMANMIFLEAPAGVGFSYSNSNADYSTDDYITARDNYQFVKQFLDAYPSYQKNAFWISGESYAGIYVPTLAKLVSQDMSINFKGIMVGNGVTDWGYDGLQFGLVPFSFGHGIISTKTYNDINEYCFGNNQNPTLCNEAEEALETAFNEIDIYNVFGDCYSQRPMMEHPFFSRAQQNVGLVPPCTDATKATDYLNTKEVKSAIHVKSDITWAICSDIVNYTNVVNNVIPIYQELMAKKFSILVYSGDCDGAVPFTGTRAWIESLNLPIVKRSWAPWTYVDDEGTQVAGFVTEYQGLTFATVRGAGHMVPQFRPQAAFEMFQRFTSGQPL